MRRSVGQALAALLTLYASAACAPVALAQGAYPAKPIRLIVPYPPGGSTDFTAREFAQRFTEVWGQQVVIDNRPGAGATIGHGIAAKSAPDGYTLLLGTSAGLVVSSALGLKLPYDPLTDFAPIGLAVYVPFALTLNVAVPANSVQELIDLARARPGQLNCASPGTGTPNHLGCELLKVMAGIDIVHVPYKGGALAVTDLIAGHVQFMYSGIPQVLAHIKTGRLKAIAIGHPTRSHTLPEAPPVAETLPGFNNTTWYGLLAPAGTPRALINRVNAEMNRALASPEFTQRLLMQGVEPATSTPEGLHAMIRSELARWRKVIKDAGISVESAR